MSSVWRIFNTGSAPVTKAEPIRVRPEAVVALDQYVQTHPETSRRIINVHQEIEGFESSYGPKLLATVHWVVTHDANASGSSIKAHEQVQPWNVRKSSLFTGPHGECAWRARTSAEWTRKYAGGFALRGPSDADEKYRERSHVRAAAAPTSTQSLRSFAGPPSLGRTDVLPFARHLPVPDQIRALMAW